MTPTKSALDELRAICRHSDPEATEYENVLLEAGWRRRDYDRCRGAIIHQGPDEKMHVEYWVWSVTNEIRAAEALALRAENERLREGLGKIISFVDGMDENDLTFETNYCYKTARQALNKEQTND